MNYTIQSRSDFLTGSYLIVKIPENDLDYYALQTIQADCPDFILPFHYKNADGVVEIVYKVGTRCKLQYLSGDLTSEEYAALWQSMLEPLLVCSDWFMNPCSFILDLDYLFFDKNKKTINYVYIPSKTGSSGYDAFFEMAVEVSKIMTVSDAVLENKVLRAIMNDFNPLEFLKMLKEHITEEKPGFNGDIEFPEKENAEAPIVAETKEPMLSDQNFGEDIFIDFQPGTKPEKSKNEKETGVYRIFSSKRKKKKTAQRSEQEISVLSAEANVEEESYYNQETPLYENNQVEIIDVTQITSLISNGTGLRYVGHGQLPPSIQVVITEGEMFTIGRFDAAVGKKQSSFEFDKKTKAVSRRHAVIERSAEGYNITDLSSSAGTYVCDKKLPPNTPYELEAGYRVSFGNSGADYVWEIN